jgi:tellurite resistance protein
MSKDRTARRPPSRRAGTIAGYMDCHEDELLDGVVSAAALVARADGWVQEVERSQLVNFFDRQGLLSVIQREDAVAHFERRVRELREPGGPAAAVQRLSHHRDKATAFFIVSIGEEVAAADSRLDPREQHMLQLVQDALEGKPR